MNTWLSVHLHVPWGLQDAAYESMLHELIFPAIQRASEGEHESGACGAFFVRYAESGPHVRLRLAGDPQLLERDVVEPLIASLLQDRDPTSAITLVRVAYEPERERYGGRAAMHEAERHFVASTRLAMAVLHTLREQPRYARFGRALGAMLAMARALGGERSDAAELMRDYSDGYVAVLGRAARDTQLRAHVDRQAWAEASRLMAQIRALWEATDMQASTGDPALHEYAAACRTYVTRLRSLHERSDVVVEGRALSWSRCVAQIVGSVMHMTNNRLGLTVMDEAFLARVLAHALVDETKRGPHSRDAIREPHVA